MRNTIYIFLFVAGCISCLSVLTEGTYSYFSDTAASQDNIFSVAQFASALPEEIAVASPSPTPTLIPTPTPSSVADHLLISEVQIDGGPSNAEHDFIELYNPTNAAIDLDGYRLVKRTGNSSSDDTIKSWTTSAIVAAHGFYLWASSSDSTYPASIGADISTTSTLTASNSIALRFGPEDTGTLVDTLSWNAGSTLVETTAFSPNPGGNQSMERKAYSSSTASSMETGVDQTTGNGYDSNNNAADFVLRTLSQPQNTTSTPETP